MSTFQDPYLRDKAIEVGVGGTLNIKGSAANIIDGFIVEENGNISVFKEGMSRKDTVVGFNHRG
jgi:hypothetical protein